MGGQSVVVERPCPECSGRAQVVIGARSEDGELRCFESLRCPSCGCAQEADGRELLEYMRNALCAVHGRWSAHVRDLGVDRVAALAALCRHLGFAPAEALRVVREAKPIVHGVLVEIEQVQALLEPAGVVLAIARVTG